MSYQELIQNNPYPVPVFGPGFAFQIMHSDGVLVSEVISSHYYSGMRYYYVCESCAVYSEGEIASAVLAGQPLLTA